MIVVGLLLLMTGFAAREAAGRTSNSFVEILSGLAEGEQVALYQPGLAK